MAANPPTPMGVMAASVPPAIITSRVGALDDFESVADGVRGRGASSGCGGIRAFRAVANRDVAGSEIDDRRRNEKRRNLARTAGQIFRMFALDDVEPADAGADVNAGGVGNFRRDFRAGHLDGEIRSCHGQLNEPAGFLQFFFFNPIQRIEIADFSGDTAIKSGGIKMGDGANAALAGEQIAPDLFGPDAASADQPNACNDNSAIQKELLLY